MPHMQVVHDARASSTRHKLAPMVLAERIVIVCGPIGLLGVAALAVAAVVSRHETGSLRFLLWAMDHCAK